MGHCSSYDEMPVIDTSVALEVLAKANEFGTVIPSNISPGPFIQIAADNNDLNEETLDGKNTTHATTMVVYQRKAFWSRSAPSVTGGSHHQAPVQKLAPLWRRIRVRTHMEWNGSWGTEIPMTRSEHVQNVYTCSLFSFVTGC